MEFQQPLFANKGLRFARSITIGIGLGITLGCVLVLLSGFVIGQATAQVAPSRFAVIDIQKVLSQSVVGRASVARLKTAQEERLAKARQMNEEMRKLDNDIKNPAVTAARRNAIEQQLAEKRIAIQRYAEDADKEIGRARIRELQELDARMKPVIDLIGKEMGLAAIFNKFESGLMYTSDSIDITGAVITRLNATAPAPGPSPRD